MTLSAPIPLPDHHELPELNAGVLELDDWLRRRARVNQANGASRTFVVCEENRVIANYALAFGRSETAGSAWPLSAQHARSNPVAVLGRLGIDQSYQGAGSAEHWRATQACACSMP